MASLRGLVGFAALAPARNLMMLAPDGLAARPRGLRCARPGAQSDDVGSGWPCCAASWASLRSPRRAICSGWLLMALLRGLVGFAALAPARNLMRLAPDGLAARPRGLRCARPGAQSDDVGSC